MRNRGTRRCADPAPPNERGRCDGPDPGGAGWFVGFVLTWVVAAVTVVGFGTTFPARGSTPRVLHALRQGKTAAAKTALEGVQSADERLFLRGYISFEQGDLRRARNDFKRLISRYPDSSRRRDALYFMDRIKLRGVGTEPPPEVRVKLAASASFEATASGTLRVREGEGPPVLRIEPGQRYRIVTSPEGVELVSDETVVGKKIVLTPSDGTRSIRLRGKTYRGKMVFHAGERRVTAINHLPLNRYLYGVVRKEIAPGWPMATVRAQAVAARSFALSRMRERQTDSFDLDASHLSQVYGGVEAETRRVIDGVEQTRGEVLVHRGKVVPAFFHANSGGHIETASSIWEKTLTPYIRPRPDTWSQHTKYARWSAEISRSRINRALVEEGHPPLAPGDTLRVSRRLPSGRARRIQYRSAGGWVRLRADKFRLALGPEILRSTWFVEIEGAGGDVRFHGRGWGHGVGMSQWGARKMAQSGAGYRKILRFYYAGARVAEQYGPSHLVASE